MGRLVIVAGLGQRAPHLGHHKLPSVSVPAQKLPWVGSRRHRIGQNQGLHRLEVGRQRNAVHLDFPRDPLLAVGRQEVLQIVNGNVLVAVAVGVVGVGDLGVDAPRQSGQKNQGKVFHRG